MLHVARMRDGSLPEWQEPLLLSDVSPEDMRLDLSGTSRLLVGLEANYGTVRQERLRWQRDQASVPVSVAEMRSVAQELAIRGGEHLRRDKAKATGFRYLDTKISAMQLDGRRVLHPVGFSGSVLDISALHYYAASDIAETISSIRQQVGATEFSRVWMLDWAARSLLTAKGVSLPAVFVQEMSTVLLTTSTHNRHVLSIGEESFAQYLARSVSELSAHDAVSFLYAFTDDDRRHRELMAVAQPALRRWARSLERVLLEAGDLPEGARLPILFPWKIPSVIRYGTRPDIVPHVFSRLPGLRFQLLTLPEMLAEPAETRHDAYAALMDALDAADPFAMNRT